MTTAKLISEIIELDQKIDNGMELSDLLDGDSLAEGYDERVSNDMEILDRLRIELANRIVFNYTGYHLGD